jgi:mono/diheme cytochrome c family protein
MPNIPDFTNRTWQQSRSNVQLTISILEGKDRQMPANRGMVSDELARELVIVVRAFAPKPQPAPTPVTPPPTQPTPTTPDVTATPGKPPARPTEIVLAPAYTPTGDFETDFDNLTKQFDHYQGQVRLLASAPPKATTPPPSVPPPSIPPTTEPPASVPPVTTAPDNPPPATAPTPAPAEPGPEKPRFATVPISERPLTADDVARGQELFLGRRPRANGGPACVTCHAVNRGEAREGGRLGPDLTKVYERLGGRTALSAQLWAPATRTMRPAYRDHGLEPDEVLALVAYLEDADKQAAAPDASPLPLKLLLLGLGGAAVGLMMVSALWAGRSRRPQQVTRNGRASLTPSPADCAGAGL